MKRSQTRILDSMLHDIVVARDGVCQMCKNPINKNGRKKVLHASHFYSKAVNHHQNMRWMPENACAMCLHCHLHKWHKEIIGSYEWYVQNIDESRRLLLAAEAMKPSKPMFGGDYEKIREYLINYKYE